MRPVLMFVAAAAAAGVLIPDAAVAQKGAGQQQGVARQAEKPDLVTLAGTLVEIDTGPCEKRVPESARAPIGAHMILETPKGKKLNIHLGPARAVEEIVEPLKVGQKLSVTAFRTENLPEDQFIAQVIIVGQKKLALRDETLRPVWAGRGRRAAERAKRAGRGPTRGGRRAGPPGAGTGRRGRCR